MLVLTSCRTDSVPHTTHAVSKRTSNSFKQKNLQITLNSLFSEGIPLIW